MVYLTAALFVLILWFLSLFQKNKIASAKIFPPPKFSKYTRVLAYISGAIIVLVIGIDYYGLYKSIFLPTQIAQSEEFVTPIVQAANNLLFYLGIIFAAIIPLLITHIITANQLKTGILSELSTKELEIRKSPKNLRNSKISIYSSIQGINWILILLGLQYIVISSFWQGFVTMCVVISIVMQITKQKLRRAIV